ncbi:uncharacterized protein I303_107509 [Kwoniella dejecticola CBS 10117]|uniref:ENTH domain-containing protein c n=1 Tax=Kwoniella dejecticola CBS 10117 TaxID=1296121 RepID=A0A1A5ZZW5_9TREE|nr:ENTH domain-containing protein c [Kwoniella dejecticola CBS 10117]OBR83349.1 ENTH domain-containing protein c [Kwoniella dejecticola CBS 10117]
MDYIEKLAKEAQNLTMYDVKSYYNQAKNMVLNVSEMEAKVREATNDDPWGASSTLMQQIADGAQFNEIMPTIYARFMEKEAREWRQIYKALTLLEFLVKNGSERVVDDARAHVSTIKMLRSFHYIDEKGKDQGINVRNRAMEIASLLGDVDKIRQERRKAKSNKNKYQGGGNDGGMSFITPGGSRYGGFGSDSLGGGGRGGSGGGAGGSRYGGRDYDAGDEYRSSSRTFRDTSAKTEYDEYEGADDFDDQPSRRAASSSSRPTGSSRPPKPVAKEEKPVEKPKEVNLFDFDDEPTPAAPAAAPAVANNSLGGDDDFDDFQQAPSSAAAPAAPTAPQGGANNANLFNLLNSNTSSVPAPQAATQTFSATQPPSYNFSPQQPQSQAQAPPSMASRPSYSSGVTSPPVTSPPAKTGASTFDDLFNTSLTSMGGQSTANKQSGNKTVADLQKEKTMSSLWGPTPTASQGQGQGGAAAQQQNANKNLGGGGFDDLLL